MAGWLAKLFGMRGRPRRQAETVPVRRFTATDVTLSRDGVSVEEEGWLIESREERVVRLFEIPAPDLEQCLLTYRAGMKCEDLAGRAYLEMWCRFSGRGEYFSKGFRQALKGTTDWSSCETSFRLRRGERPDLIKLNVVMEGPGRVWVKDVELLKTPL